MIKRNDFKQVIPVLLVDSTLPIQYLHIFIRELWRIVFLLLPKINLLILVIVTVIFL